MAHFAKFIPTQSIVRRAMLAVQDSMPYRLSCVYILHAQSFITNIINIFYPLLKEKLIKKVSWLKSLNKIITKACALETHIYFLFLQFHIFNGGAEELYAYMNKDILPNEWGGKAGAFQELNGKYIIF